MKCALFILAFSFISFQGRAFPVVTNEVNGTFNATSYDVQGHKTFGDYFATFFYLGYPQFTNHITSWSRSGNSWQADFEGNQQKYCLPLWEASEMLPLNDWIMANNNGGYTTTNPLIQWGTNLFNAPPIFWDGVSPTNGGTHANSQHVTHYFLGDIPNDSADGDSGAVNRTLATLQLASKYGTPPVDTWSMTWTNGVQTDRVGARIFGYDALGHPYAAGSLCMALKDLIALGVETNIGSVMIDGNTSIATTNHVAVTNIIKNGNTLTFAMRFDRMPPGWDVPDGTITNDARGAFVLMPELGNSFQWTIQVTNLPAGTYNITVDGVLTDIATASQLAVGRNWFTNYNGPLWAQRALVLKWKRYQNGVDPVTLLEHSAGSNGFLGVGDNVNFQSNAQQQYDDFGKRGDTYIAAMATFVSQKNQYDDAINHAAQQTTHLIVVSLVVAVVFPITR